VTGGCRCGAVRFAVDHGPVTVRVCWCRDCQYVAAGSPTVSAVFRVSGLARSGAVAEFARTAASGTAIRHGFCPACGTPVYAQSAARPELVAVRVGTLDEPGAVRPEVAIWTGSAPCWADDLAALPRVAAQPGPIR
jgi:hypothetical protein